MHVCPPGPIQQYVRSMYDIAIPASPVWPLGIGQAWDLWRAWLPVTDLFSFRFLFIASIPRLRSCSQFRSQRVWHAIWLAIGLGLLERWFILRVTLGFFFLPALVACLGGGNMVVSIRLSSWPGPDAPLLQLILHQWHAQR